MVAEDSLKSVRTSIEGLQAKIDSITDNLTAKEQKYLVTETVEEIQDRVIKRTKDVTYFLVIPIAVLSAIVLAMTGRSLTQLLNVALNARATIEPMIAQAKSDAELAAKNAGAARRESTIVENQVKKTSDALEPLKEKSRELDFDIQNRKASLAGIQTKLANQSAEIKGIQEQIKSIDYNKYEQAVIDVFPELAEEPQRVVSADKKVMSERNKSKGDIFVSLNYTSGHLQINDQTMARAYAALSGWKFKVFLGNLSLQSNSNNERAKATATLSGDFCESHNIPAPCIVYFDQSQYAAAKSAAYHLDEVLVFRANQIRYVDPKSLNPNLQQLIKKSALDLLLIL
jgi:hypothetical protein